MNRRRIAVNNVLLDGLESSDTLPTFLLNTVGMTRERIEWEVETVGYLQAICPVFRVVVMTDLPLFSIVRKYGWPVEHLMASEYHAKVLTGGDYISYTHERVRIAAENFDECTVVDWEADCSLAATIAHRVGYEGPSGVAIDLTGDTDTLQVGSSSWRSEMKRLLNGDVAVFESAEGRVEISVSGRQLGSLFVLGRSTADGHVDGLPSLPGGVVGVFADFDPSASVEFESFVYAALSRDLGRDLAVVLPWRNQALLRDDTVFWVDLGVWSEGGDLRVVPEYAGAYSVLMPSGDLDWRSAARYAAIRRVSRGLSVDRTRHWDNGLSRPSSD